MRLIAPRNSGPAAVNKYLLPHEHQVITVRKHPAVLIGPIAIALAGLLIALVVGTTVLRHSHNGIIVLVFVGQQVLVDRSRARVARSDQSHRMLTESSRTSRGCGRRS
jgi:hypothetical protein